jgi:mRNA interferase YafQ
MREIERTAKFRPDYRRETRGRHRATIDASLAAVLVPLMNDEPLAER